MVRVLLVTKLFDPVIGGVETVVRQIATYIGKDKRFSVTVLSGNEKAFSLTRQYFHNEAIIVKTASAGLIYHTAISPSYPFMLQQLIKHHDILHFHTPNPLGELSFFFNKIPREKKVIVTVYADISQTRKKRYGPVYNFLLKRLLNRADVITTMTPQNLEGFPVLKSYQSKCVIVPLAFDESHTISVSREDIHSFRKQYDLDGSANTMLFAGRLTEDKGVSYLLKSLQYLQNVQLVIVGDGELKKQLMKQAAEITKNKIVFTGFLNSHDMACAFSCAGVFVLPSIKETFGIVQAEAMHFGLPVINTNLNTGVNYVSIHNKTGLTVPPADEKALAAAINSIFSDEELRARFSQQAKERSENFTPGKMTDTFKAIYLQKNRS